MNPSLAATPTASSTAAHRSGPTRAALSPVRVLHLVPRLEFGGMEQGVIKLLNGLSRDRVVGSVCSLDGADDIRNSLDPSVPVYLTRRRRGNTPRLVWDLAALLRRQRPDVVHTHSWGTLCEGFVAARAAGIPYFVHGEHGTMDLRPRNCLVQRWVWGRADRVLSVSSTLADRMAMEIGFPRHRVEVIRNGTDLARFSSMSKSDARRQLGVSAFDFVLGTVGRLVPVKDHLTLLDSVASLVRDGVQCTVLLVGDGPLREHLEQRAHAIGLGGAVRFLGGRSDVERILPALDVFVLTSTSEGLPNTIIEAMAARLPVVSTRVGGVGELVEDGKTGVLVPPASRDRLAAAILQLIRDLGRARSMGAAGYFKAQTEFGLHRMLNDYERMYIDLARHPGAAPK